MKSTILALAFAAFAAAEPVVQQPQILQQGFAPQRYLYDVVHTPGRVRLNLTLNEKGEIMRYKVLNGRPDLTPAAIRIVHDWKFQPATVDGHAVVSNMDVIVGFSFQS